MSKALVGLGHFYGVADLRVLGNRKSCTFQEQGSSGPIQYISGLGDQCRGEYLFLRLAWVIVCRRSAEPGQTQVFFRSCSVFVFEFGRNFPQMSCYCTSPLVQTIHLSTAPGQQNIVHQEYCKNCTVLTSGIARWRDGGLGRVPREGLQPMDQSVNYLLHSQP